MKSDCFKSLFDPHSVVVIGASQEPGKIGHELLKNLKSGGSKAHLSVVNPNYDAVLDVPCYPSIEALPHIPQLAVIVSPAETVPEIIEELGAKGCRMVIVISAGLNGPLKCKQLRLGRQMLERARYYNIHLIGPNCLGILSPTSGLNASFSHLMPGKGKIGVISQSATMLTSIIDWGLGNGIGFSHLVSLGDMADIGFSEMLDCMVSDPNTNAILLYMESVPCARTFVSAARAAARTKPVVVLKGGYSREGIRAATAHTFSVIGEDEVYEAAFNRAGLVRVYDIRGLFHAAAILTAKRPLKQERLAIVTNGGGIGVLATDALIKQGGTLATLSDDTLKQLNEVLPNEWSHGNPIDIIGDADPQRYAQALDVVMQDPGVDAVLVINCPTALASGLASAEVVVKAAENYRKFLLVSWIGKQTAAECQSLFAEHAIPFYETPEEAVSAFMYLVRYRRNQSILMETPPTIPADLSFDTNTAWALIGRANSERREWLDELESKKLLDAYGIPVVPTRLARSPEEASIVAEELGYPVVLKLFSPDIRYKSEVRGVVLNLSSSQAVLQAARDVEKTAQQLRPDARLEGFSIQKMCKCDDAHMLQVGIFHDQVFGPVISFGQGGGAVSLLDDKTLALPPLNMKLARDMVARTRIFKLLEGYRNMKSANMDELLLTLIRLSHIVVDLDHIEELVINPLLVNDEGVLALNARVKLSPALVSGAERLAIHPYPSQYEERVRMKTGDTYMIRPIRPEDEPALIRNFDNLDAEEVRFRFFHVIKEMDHVMAARLTQIDYDREMALVVTERNGEEDGSLYAVVRLILDITGDRAEFALIVNHRVTHQGLGTLLMRRIIAYARDRNLSEVYGEVLSENKGMIRICRALGFQLHTNPDDPSIMEVSLLL